MCLERLNNYGDKQYFLWDLVKLTSNLQRSNYSILGNVNTPHGTWEWGYL